MSKTGKYLGKFIVGSLLATTMLTPVYAQTANTNGAVGTINQSDLRLRNIDNLSSAQGQRDQLIGTPAPIDQTVQDTQNQQPIILPSTQIRATPVTPATQVFNPNDPNLSTQGNVATPPVQTGIPATPEVDPFGPTGIRLGTYDVNISLEQAVGYSSNVSEQVAGASGGFSETTIDADITSDWSRHQWQTNINGSFRRPFDDDEIDQPQLQVDTALRLDLIDGYTLTTRGFYNIATQGFTSSTLAPGAVDNPIQENWGGSLELQRTDRKLQLTLRGDVDRDEFQPSDLGGGIVQNEGDRNNNEYRVTARVGYEISPALTPFVEGAYAIRDLDQELDRNGNDRDSDIFDIRGGVEIDLGEKLTGEIAIGYVNESFDDPALESLDAFTINGQINYSPQRETQIGLTLGTQTNDSIITGDNGSIIYNARVDVDRQLTQRFSVNAFGDAQIETNDDNNTTLQTGVGTVYWVNRFVAITSQVDYLRFSTDAPGSTFEATSGQIGVRLQR